MKIGAAAADAFVAKPNPATVAVLLYGPDRGLVQERAERLIRTVVDTLDDPFRLVDLAATTFTSDPARLADEAAAQSLTGGRRVVRIRGAGNDLSPTIEAVLKNFVGDALIVVEAGELSAKAKLRSLFEKAPNAASIACYQDESAALETVIKETLSQRGVSVSVDALAYISSRLGADRKVTRSELEKLALFMGERTEVTEADAIACVGDSSEMDLDDLADATGTGDHVAATRALTRLIADGVNPIAILRALQRHFQRLHMVTASIAAGTPADAAVSALRPPIFYKRRTVFGRQTRTWPLRPIETALDLLLEAELDCKTTGLPANSICGHAVTRLTEAAARFGRRGQLEA